MANGRVREYIGARYVPVFADPVTWDDERAYDPLTMVQYLGETYMSKQYVPIGAQLPTVAQGEESNEFWVHMSNWNAQVEAYREEVMRYAEEVSAFDDRIDTLEDDLPSSNFSSTNTVKKYVDDNIDSVEALLPASNFSSTNTVKKYVDDSIKTAENVTDSISERKFLLLGDSYGRGTYRKPDNSGYADSSNGWLRYMTNVMASRTGCEVYSNLDTIVTGNSGFTSSGAFINVIEDLIKRKVVPHPEEITDIVILSGTNDVGSTEATVYDAVRTFFARAYQLFPNVKRIKLGYISVFVTHNEVINGYRRGVEEYGGMYLGSLRNLFVRRELVSPDGGHPSDAGYEFYRDFIVDAVFNGNITYSFTYELNFTAPTNYTLQNLQGTVIVDETEVKIKLGRNTVATGDDACVIPASTPSGTISQFLINIPCSNMPFFTRFYSKALFNMFRQYDILLNTNETHRCTVMTGGGFVLSSNGTVLSLFINSFFGYASMMNFRYVFPEVTFTI